jgi:hypothetical protein
MEHTIPFKVRLEDRMFVVTRLKTTEATHHKVKAENVGKVREVDPKFYSTIDGAINYIHSSMVGDAMSGVNLPLMEWLHEYKLQHERITNLISDFFQTLTNIEHGN